MNELVINNNYSREEVKNILDPGGNYTPGAGTWGIHGVINIKQEFKNFVFFVTYGRKQGNHTFDEGISEEGILSWQTQPSQHLKEERVLRWVSQKENDCKIHLFVRNDKRNPFIYLGELDYQNHNRNIERPVWFTFKIKNWRYSPQMHQKINPLEKVNAQEKKWAHEPVNPGKNAEELAFIESIVAKFSDALGFDGGERLRFNYETTAGSIIPLVVEGAGKNKWVVGLNNQDHDRLLFLEVTNIIKFSVELAIEAGEPLASANIRCVLFARRGNYPVAVKTAKKYGVKLIFLDTEIEAKSND